MTTEGGTTQSAGEERWPPEQRWPPGEQRWWKLLRRAFGIPDIVSGNHREAAVTQALLKRLPAPSLEMQTPYDPQMDRVHEGSTVVRTIAKMGGGGELDELFVALGLARANRDTLRARVVRVTGPLETAGLVKETFEVITRYVGAHPFED
jgi:hypothetical protein